MKKRPIPTQKKAYLKRSEEKKGQRRGGGLWDKERKNQVGRGPQT